MLQFQACYVPRTCNNSCCFDIWKLVFCSSFCCIDLIMILVDLCFSQPHSKSLSRSLSRACMSVVSLSMQILLSLYCPIDLKTDISLDVCFLMYLASSLSHQFTNLQFSCPQMAFLINKHFLPDLEFICMFFTCLVRGKK